MEISEQMRAVVTAQKDQIHQMEEAVSRLEEADYVRENTALLQEAQALRAEVQATGEQLTRLTRENRELNERLMEQLYARKQFFLEKSMERYEAAYFPVAEGEESRLRQFEQFCLQRLSQLRGELLRDTEEDFSDLHARIDGLEQQVRYAAAQAREKAALRLEEERGRIVGGYERLGGEPLDPAQVQQSLRKDNMELKIGGRLTNIVGLVFVVVAVVLGLRYTYTYLLQSNGLKVAAAYFLGALFLGSGEYMHRRQRSPFSIGLSSGGVGILFASTAVAYFNLQVFPMYTAILVCVLITVLTLFLSLRYDSQLIGIFALVGGYLPMTALDGGFAIITGAKAYFLLLNVLVLLIASRKSWQILKFFSFWASTLGFHILFWTQRNFVPGLDITYLLLCFVLYLAIPLAYPILKKNSPRLSDTVLMGLNAAVTFGGCLLVFRYAGWNHLYGGAAFVFCAFHYILGKVLKNILTQDEAKVRGLFYVASFVFLLLAVPLQFDGRLVTLGWLFAGVGLFIYGGLAGQRWYSRAGGGLYGASVLSFLLYDVLRYWAGMEKLFIWQYTAVTLGGLGILVMLIYRHRGHHLYWTASNRGGVRAFRFAVLLNIWVYGLWLSGDILARMGNLPQREFWECLLFAGVTLGLSYALPRIKQIGAREISGLGSFLSLAGIGLTFRLNAVSIGLSGTGILLNILLIAFDFGAVWAAWTFLKRVFRKTAVWSEWPPVLLSLYILALVTMVMVNQWTVSPESMMLSFVYLAGALGAVILGFVLRYTYLRRFGLVLLFLSVSKLFLLDLSFLVNLQRILSYFVFGFTLIGVSYVYQYFAKRITVPVTVKADGGTVQPNQGEASLEEEDSREDPPLE